MKVKNLEQVQYSLALNNHEYPLNGYIGQPICIEYLEDIHCMSCGKSTIKSYNQGHCYQCFQLLAQNDRCIMSPEHCHYDKGTCREPEWGLQFCMQPHVVYLSWTSGLKVGLSRFNHYVSRWMDQGATHGVAVCRVKTRHQAGLVEDFLRKWYRDRTQWKAMLQMEYNDKIDLLEEKHKMLLKLKDFDIEILEDDVHHFHYPVEAIGPLKPLGLDSQKRISGYLLGIKGQYLILDTGVINIRKHGAYLVEVTLG